MSKVKLLLKGYRNLLILVPVRDGNWVAQGEDGRAAFYSAFFLHFIKVLATCTVLFIQKSKNSKKKMKRQCL